MKLAICEWVTPIKGPAIFPRLKSLGIDGIQLDDWDAAAQNHPLTQSYVQRLYKDAAAQTGISLIGVAGNALGRDGGMILPMDTEQGRRCWDDLTRGPATIASAVRSQSRWRAFFRQPSCAA